MPLVSLAPAANLPPVSWIPVAICNGNGTSDNDGKFAANIVDTVATVDIDTGSTP